MRVWNACISFIAYDRDGEIAANRTQISEVAEVSPQQTSRAMTQLVDIGALVRTKPGRYAINSHVGWSGPLHKREIAAKEQMPVPPPAPGPLLVVMEGGKS
jgi:predicted transcriptional regulator of viral defense system